MATYSNFVAGRSKGVSFVHNIELRDASDVVPDVSTFSSLFVGATVNDFGVAGGSVYANITGNFVLTGSAVSGSDISLFDDIDNLCTEVGSSFFNNCSLLEFFNSNNVQVFRGSSFLGCALLSSVTSLYVGVDIESSAFNACYSCFFNLKISSLGSFAFIQCFNFNFQNITFTNSLDISSRTFRQTTNHALYPVINIDEFTSLGFQAFLSSSGLTNVTFNNVLLVDFNGVFANNQQLLTLDLPNTGMSENTSSPFSQSAFSGLINLNTLNISKLKKTINNSIDTGLFANINPTCTINIDSSMETANGGNPDADVQYLLDRGCTVNYIINP